MIVNGSGEGVGIRRMGGEVERARDMRSEDLISGVLRLSVVISTT
jgi:hypothetical protein